MTQITTALYINGIYDHVLDEIIRAQKKGCEHSFLQPHNNKAIKMLQKNLPSKSNPIRLYISTSSNLTEISYTAKIISWEDKNSIATARFKEVRSHLNKYQNGEQALLDGIQDKGKDSVNLITIVDLKQLKMTHPTSYLIKTSDDQPLKIRTRSGGWSEVYDLGDLKNKPFQTQLKYNEILTKQVHNASRLSLKELVKLAEKSPQLPERILVTSFDFQRSPYVIAAALKRANGVCEKCKKPAPFKRRSDSTPYLEVHHVKQLSQGGEDTLSNAIALCPNCHRELHHG